MDDADFDIVQQSAAHYQKALTQAGFGQITTEIAKNKPFILLRIIISNISIKCRMAIVAFVELGLVQIDAFDAITI